jgi:hypothetical protein
MQADEASVTERLAGGSTQQLLDPSETSHPHGLESPWGRLEN